MAQHSNWAFSSTHWVACPLWTLQIGHLTKASLLLANIPPLKNWFAYFQHGTTQQYQGRRLIQPEREYNQGLWWGGGRPGRGAGTAPGERVIEREYESGQISRKVWTVGGGRGTRKGAGRVSSGRRGVILPHRWEGCRSGAHTSIILCKNKINRWNVF